MRLWSIKFEYLDSKGLVALWREALLAKHVLDGKTKGYKHHPQLNRFYAQESPKDYIRAYLEKIYNESLDRRYNFNKLKIENYDKTKIKKIPITNKQIEYEFNFLQNKLKTRDPKKYEHNKLVKKIQTMELFTITIGEIENWEKVK